MYLPGALGSSPEDVNSYLPVEKNPLKLDSSNSLPGAWDSLL